MSSNKKKNKWQVIDPAVGKRWHILKMDGSNFKALRYPNITLFDLEKYYEYAQVVAKKVFDKFKYIKACLIIDDEFHWLINTRQVKDDERKNSKIVVLTTSYVTALFNGLINSDSLNSRKLIKSNELCFDGELIKMEDSQIAKYYSDIVNNGKLFLGNSIVGNGERFLRLSMDKLMDEAKEKKYKLEEKHNLLFGLFVTNKKILIRLNDFEIEEYKKKIINIIKRKIL
jgi:hypothetical protein